MGVLVKYLSSPPTVSVYVPIAVFAGISSQCCFACPVKLSDWNLDSACLENKFNTDFGFDAVFLKRFFFSS